MVVNALGSFRWETDQQNASRYKLPSILSLKAKKNDYCAAKLKSHLSYKHLCLCYMMIVKNSKCLMLMIS